MSRSKTHRPTTMLPTSFPRVPATPAQRATYEAILAAVRADNMPLVKQLYYNWFNDELEPGFNVGIHPETVSLHKFWTAAGKNHYMNNAFSKMFQPELPLTPHLELFEYFHNKCPSMIPKSIIMREALWHTIDKQHPSDFVLLRYLHSLGYRWFFPTDARFFSHEMDNLGWFVAADDPTTDPNDYTLTAEQASQTKLFAEALARFCFSIGMQCNYFYFMSTNNHFNYRIISIAFEMGVAPPMDLTTQLATKYTWDDFPVADRIKMLDLCMANNLSWEMNILDLFCEEMKKCRTYLLKLKRKRHLEDLEDYTLQHNSMIKMLKYILEHPSDYIMNDYYNNRLNPHRRYSRPSAKRLKQNFDSSSSSSNDEDGHMDDDAMTRINDNCFYSVLEYYIKPLLAIGFDINKSPLLAEHLHTFVTEGNPADNSEGDDDDESKQHPQEFRVLYPNLFDVYLTSKVYADACKEALNETTSMPSSIIDYIVCNFIVQA